MAVFSTLMVFTALTVLAAYHNFGPYNVVIALAIATIKGSLVVLFFMHAWYIPKRTQLVVVSGLFWLAIMLFMTMSDYWTR